MPIVRSRNINNTFFYGFYKDLWRKIVPEGLTMAETEFIVEVCALEKNDKVLDIMCGYGRHAIQLGKRGYDVTAVDNLQDYVDDIRAAAKNENLQIECLETDVMQMDLIKTYDAAICMGNSFSVFDYDNAIQLLLNISSHLKRGGKLIINSWMIGEIIIRDFKEKGWNYSGGYKYLVDNKYLFNPSRIESEHTLISAEGQIETKNAIDYIFTFSELEKMLNDSGFVLKEIFSSPKMKKYKFGDSRAYIVAEKV